MELPVLHRAGDRRLRTRGPRCARGGGTTRGAAAAARQFPEGGADIAARPNAGRVAHLTTRRRCDYVRSSHFRLLRIQMIRSLNLALVVVIRLLGLIIIGLGGEGTRVQRMGFAES